MDSLRTLRLVLAGSALCLCPARGGDAPPAPAGGVLTLKQCVDAAYGLSPALKAEQLDIDAGGQEIIRQRTALLPSASAAAFGGVVDGYALSLSAVVTGQHLGNAAFIRTVTPGALNGNQNNASSILTNGADWAPYGVQRVEIDYGLFQGGSILGLNNAPTIAAAQASKNGLEWTRKLGEEKVVFDLSNAYFMAQWFQQKTARDEARVHFARQQVEIMRSMFELELKLAQDVDLAKAELSADEKTLAADRQGVRDSYAVLALLIGRPATPVLRLAAASPKFPTLPPLAELIQKARNAHPNVGVQRSVADYALAKLRLDEAAILPQASFSTSYSVGENFQQIAASNVNTPTRYEAGVTISVPVWDWGSRLANVREDRAKLHAERERTEQVQLDVGTALARLYSNENDLERQLGALVAAQVATDNSARLAREQRSAGSLNQLTVDVDEITLLNAEDATESERLLVLENYAALQQAAGGTWNWVR